MTCKLPTVPEEQTQNTGWNYSELDLISSAANIPVGLNVSRSNVLHIYLKNKCFQFLLKY